MLKSKVTIEVRLLERDDVWDHWVVCSLDAAKRNQGFHVPGKIEFLDSALLHQDYKSLLTLAQDVRGGFTCQRL